MMIRHKLKTLNELKIKIMEELQVNPALHDIHITFRCPHEVLNQCINYRYMPIKEDKHVKIMFNMMERWAQVANIELCVTLEPRAEVSIEEIIQTTTSLQVAVLDNHNNITLGGYTPPFQETPTTIESEPSNRYEDQFCTHRGKSSTLPVVEDEDCFGEDLDDRDEYEERIERGDFDRGVDDHEITPNPHVDDMAECDEDDADAAITVQHVTNTPPVYEPPASSFYANTWENMVDPEVVQQEFASSWNADMNFAKGFIFANKEAVKRALIIYAAKAEFVPLLQKKHTATIFHLGDFITAKYEHKLSYYKIWDAKQKAIARIFGDWEESYQRLRKLLLAYSDQEIGTRFWYHTIRNEGIQNGIANWRRDDDGRVRVIHRYCLRHVASNFNTHFQDATLKSLALQARYATQEAKFELYMQPIKEAEIEALRKKLRTGRQEILQLLEQDATRYIDPCYSLENAIRTYSHQFMVPKSESLWRDVDGPKWVPDPALLRGKGRPVKSRIRNEMDGVRRESRSRRPDSDLREIQQQQSCGLCHQHGHNRRRCPLSRGASTSSNDPN
ncbi:hypothetical protein SO802_017659 [Lithocarpus litseifolius]|uniref:Transposase n=1 Tax=Lithocarpus litseifolius TaxID=425828 RepID=A0AAW2CIM1_9ROSI